MAVSVVDPVSTAYQWAKYVLFTTGSFEKWLHLGFCAWLSQLGQGGGANFNFNMNLGGPQDFQWLEDLVEENLEVVIAIGVGLVLLVLGVMILFAWLSSRGAFMFLDGVLKNRSAVKEPWRVYRSHGNSLFWFRMALWVLTILAFVVLVGVVAALLITSIENKELDGLGIAGIVVGGVGLLAVIFLLAFLHLFLEDFVIPIAYLRGQGIMAAWSEFYELFRENLGNFIIYVLFKFVLGIAVGMMVCVVALLFCCVMWLPFVGTVILLPFIVFNRTYTIHYLAQYGPEYAALRPVAAAPAAPSAPAAPPALPGAPAPPAAT